MQAGQVKQFGRRGFKPASSVTRASFEPTAVATSSDAHRSPRAMLADLSVDVDAGMIRAFVGENVATFQTTIEAMQGQGFRGLAFKPACALFFFPMLWLLYRKMWTAAVGLFMATLVLHYLAPKPVAGLVTLAVNLLICGFGRSLYLRSAATRIREILATAGSASEAIAGIRQQGGTSSAAVWAACLLGPAIGVAAFVARTYSLV